MGWGVYIIYSASKDIYYKGESESPFRRLADHNNDESRYTSGKGPWKLVYLEVCANRTEALIREKMLKKQNRRYIEWLLVQPINQLLKG